MPIFSFNYPPVGMYREIIAIDYEQARADMIILTKAVCLAMGVTYTPMKLECLNHGGMTKEATSIDNAVEYMSTIGNYGDPSIIATSDNLEAVINSTIQQMECENWTVEEITFYRQQKIKMKFTFVPE